MYDTMYDIMYDTMYDIMYDTMYDIIYDIMCDIIPRKTQPLKHRTTSSHSLK